jgi:hypothetical protein
MKIDGACHCGYITFEAEVDPDKVSICNCTDCQTLSGAPLRASVPAEADKFRLLSGEPSTYVKVAESGNRRAQTFCPRCGSPLYATAADDPNAIRMVRLGVVRQRDELAPKRQVWIRSQAPWVGAIASIPGAEAQR